MVFEYQHLYSIAVPFKVFSDVTSKKAWIIVGGNIKDNSIGLTDRFQQTVYGR
jgi:hypothetical protein